MRSAATAHEGTFTEFACGRRPHRALRAPLLRCMPSPLNQINVEVFHSLTLWRLVAGESRSGGAADVDSPVGCLSQRTGFSGPLTFHAPRQYAGGQSGVWKMRSKLLALATAASLALAGAASAATVISTSSDGNFTYTIHNGGTADPSLTDNNILFDDIQGPANLFVVDYTAGASQVITEQNPANGGFAFIQGTYRELTITPESGFDGFTAFRFNFETPQFYAAPRNLSFELDMASGPNQLFTLTDANPNGGDDFGNGKFVITAGAGEVIKGVKLYNFAASGSGMHPDQPAPALFGEIKQASFEAFIDSSAAPEPAAWAMMIMGFGGVGAMIRRRRTLAA